jgi:hypothetical protein
MRVIKSIKMKWTGYALCVGVNRNIYKILVGKPEGKRPPGRLERRWDDKIRIDLTE